MKKNRISNLKIKKKTIKMRTNQMSELANQICGQFRAAIGERMFERNNDRRGRQASILYGSTVIPGFDTRETYFVLTWCALVLYSVTV